jgi:hypothetical protein
MHHYLQGGSHPDSPLAVLSITQSVDRADALTFATINGTILAIVIAALSGYALVVFQSLDKMRTDFIEHANAVNNLRYGVIQYGVREFDTRDSFG